MSNPLDHEGNELEHLRGELYIVKLPEWERVPYRDVDFEGGRYRVPVVASVVDLSKRRR